MIRVARTVAAVLAIAALSTPAMRAESQFGWQPAPHDLIGGFDLFASVAEDRRIYAFGGGVVFVGGKYRVPKTGANLERYDTRTASWQLLASGLSGYAAIAAGGKIYAVGGYLGPQPVETYVYTIRTNRWVLGIPSGEEHWYCAAALGHDGRIYAIGGDGSGGGGGEGNGLEAFDPQTNSWTALPSIPLTLERPAAATGLDGRIYVLGGTTEVPLTGAMALTNAVEAYSPWDRRWTRLAPMPTARAELAAVTAPDGRIYAIGGATYPDPHNTTFGPPKPLGTVEIYDPRTNRWSTGPSLRVPRWGLGAALGPDGKIYAIGGSSGTTVETLQIAPPAGK
jgi:N-acetylneuraminic acid mutarotase